MRRICVVTGSRAEYGILKPLLDEIRSDLELELQLVVTCMHLSPEFDLTFREIESDGFDIDWKLESLLSSDTGVGTAKSMALTTAGVADAFQQLAPDLVVVLGDRFELLAIAAAASVMKLPIAHISGGDLTQGAFDDAIRHAITKLSHVHFPTTDAYAKRVIQLGEAPATVYQFGSLGIDSIKRSALLDKQTLEQQLEISFASKNLLITFHPVTLEKEDSSQQFSVLLDALAEFSRNTNIYFTYPNADPGGREIIRQIEEYVRLSPKHSKAFPSLGSLKYHSLLQFVDAVVGNSSSGITEVPSFKIGTINIGTRQQGRIQAASVINCSPEKQAIGNALQELYSDSFQSTLSAVVNPYGDGKAAPKIKETLKSLNLANITCKQFYDLV